MKKTIKLLLLATAVLVLMVVACSDSDSLWIRIGKTATGENYYDKNSIHQTDQGIRIIKTKAVYGAEGKKTKRAFLESIGKHEKTPQDLHHEIRIWRVDCKHKKINPFSSTIYDAENNIIVSSPEFPDKWDDILPESLADKIQSIVCKE
ncbi:MAG TPA: hypothetical protein P5040_07695 [Smithella sp.]|nr:hypothetical protein [Smithella sp.]HRS98056.1 hypothetical protein [Smithella sp.]